MENINIMELSQQNLCDYLLDKYNLEVISEDTEIFIIKPRLGPMIMKFLHKFNTTEFNPDEDTDDEEDPLIEKLYSGTDLKRSYEFLLGNDFVIEFAYSIDKKLEEKLKSRNFQSKMLFQILAENGIEVLYNNHSNYQTALTKWVFA